MSAINVIDIVCQYLRDPVLILRLALILIANGVIRRYRNPVKRATVFEVIMDRYLGPVKICSMGHVSESEVMVLPQMRLNVKPGMPVALLGKDSIGMRRGVFMEKPCQYPYLFSYHASPQSYLFIYCRNIILPESLKLLPYVDKLFFKISLKHKSIAEVVQDAIENSIIEFERAVNVQA